MPKYGRLLAASFIALIDCSTARAATQCQGLPDYATLKKALMGARNADNGGLPTDMWGAVVDRTGQVCAVAFTGKDVGDQWPASRAIAVEKANTANAMSLPKYALSTANLYAGSQPGGYLYGVGLSNPVEPHDLQAGDPATYGSQNDPLIGKRPGGIIVFGGGLALYNASGTLVGALGASGNTSCADHNIAWRTRHALNMDHVPAGPSPKGNDAIIYDINAVTGKSASGFGQPTCGNKEDKIAEFLPNTAAVGKK